MKKVLLFIGLLLFSISVFACKKEVTSPLVISKVFDATVQANNAIELYNTSNELIDLKDYALDFYSNGSKEVSTTIMLEGQIKANDYFAVASKNANDEDLVQLRDFSYEEGSLPYNGNDAIALVYKDVIIDYIGIPESDVEFAKDLTLIRLGNKEDYKGSKTFDLFSFIYYLPDRFNYLKNDTHAIKTLEQLYEGPKLEDRYKSMPYVDPNNSTFGGGGALKTTVQRISDGDTAHFNAVGDFVGGSVRYFYLNTPEVDGTMRAEAWGYVASKYNKEYLLNDPSSKEIYIQSMKGYSLTEGYGRSLALVWINGHLSQFLIVSEGLSEDVGMKYEAHDLAMHYKDVPYLTFLRFAENRAKQNGWATKGYPIKADGEKSPDWNYQTSTNTTTSPQWQPHLPIPWA